MTDLLLIARMRRWAAPEWRRARPWWARAKAAWRVPRFARVYDVSPTDALSLLIHCVRSGAQPGEAFAWSRLFPAEVPHPLPAHAAVPLFARLGDAADRRVLTDKCAAADLLRQAGVPTPTQIAVLPRGRHIDRKAELWRTPAALFAKPRHGAAGRNCLAIDVLAGGRIRIYGREVDHTRLFARLTTVVADDDLLIQERVACDPALSALVGGAADDAPVVRLTTARLPDGDPFLQSALLLLKVPGEHRRDGIRGDMRIPIHPRSGRLGSGIWLAQPEQRFDRLPWNGASFATQPVPWFDEAQATVLRAMQSVAGLPVVAWDLILSPTGPILLEGNTAGNWLLANLPRLQGFDATPLVPLLERWMHHRMNGR